MFHLHQQLVQCEQCGELIVVSVGLDLLYGHTGRRLDTIVEVSQPEDHAGCVRVQVGVCM